VKRISGLLGLGVALALGSYFWATRGAARKTRGPRLRRPSSFRCGDRRDRRRRSPERTARRV